jgi:hypothetical protein
MEKHAILSASSAEKWLTCPASLGAEKLAGAVDDTSIYAAEGTCAHKIAELCLRPGVPPYPDEYLGTVHKVDGYDITVDQEMVDAVGVYLDYLFLTTHAMEDRHVELKVDYSPWAPEGFGTSDFVFLSNGNTCLHVVDLKYGKGISVSAERNKQMMLYALGAINTLKLKAINTVVLCIVQPRMDSISEHPMSVNDLYDWADNEVSSKPGTKPGSKANLAYDLYNNPDWIRPEDFTPSEKGCQWCKIRKTCLARAAGGYAVAVEGFSKLDAGAQAEVMAKPVTDADLVNVHEIKNDQLSGVWQSINLFQAWAKELYALILDKLMAGEDVPGLKPVATTGNRAWSIEDEADIIAALRTAGLKKTDYEVINIISPTQAEAKLKKARPDDYKKRYGALAAKAITRPAGATKIVPESDKRPSIAPAGFQDETDLSFLD